MKKTYKIEVDCPNCANKIEEHINQMEGIKSASINFLTQKFIIDFEDDVETKSLMKKVIKTCQKIDGDCEITL